MTVQTFILNLGYHKQGDDLAECLLDEGATLVTGEDTPPDKLITALESHAKMLETSAEILRKVASQIFVDIKDINIYVEADGHEIFITAPGSMVEMLQKLNVPISVIDIDDEG